MVSQRVRRGRTVSRRWLSRAHVHKVGRTRRSFRRPPMCPLLL
jgi:hypothetical protein